MPVSQCWNPYWRRCSSKDTESEIKNSLLSEIETGCFHIQYRFAPNSVFAVIRLSVTILWLDCSNDLISTDHLDLFTWLQDQEILIPTAVQETLDEHHVAG